ncbi:TIGR04551 family protein [Cystobacter fuscus]|uniref:TIGR04551 family protein n=1 Tax=Cystobacter fuscus TaxID=43 RepID=UPI002B2EF7D0|nr:TIGR04551 family protein [Cystobacter fuscus]
MSSNALLAALLVASATAAAQTPETPPTGSPAPAPESAQPSTPPSSLEPTDSTEERIRQEVERRVEAAKQEMREEIRAQLATQSLASDWQEEWMEEKRKLELFTLDGYFRLRPNLYNQFDLGKQPERRLFPSPRTNEHTQSGADMRLRLEPTFNISEEVRVKAQFDVLDNLLLGSTPSTSFPSDGYYLFDLFNDRQTSPRAGLNALRDAFSVREVYGEVSTPVGLLRFGRMNAHWGLGLLRNDGNCLECDYGDQVDRVMFVTEPLEGFYVTPMFEFNNEGRYAYPNGPDSEPVDVSKTDDVHSFVLAVARRDTPQQVKAKLDNNQGVLNYGLHVSYRSQQSSSEGLNGSGAVLNPDGSVGGNITYVPRNASLVIPDVWLRYEEKNFRVEFEVAAYLGTIGSRQGTPLPAGNLDPNQNQSLTVAEFGGAAVGEYRLLNGKLNIQLELGFASGDRAPGFGAYPGRAGSGPGGFTQPGDADGPQFRCGGTDCADSYLRNFRFNRAYRVDNILFRELIGTVTDAFYAKPTLRYTLTQGFDVFGSAVYSQAIYPQSTPSFTDRPLGLETNLGARYETEDGFVARVDWSVLFPLSGLQDYNTGTGLAATELKTAHAVRGTIGIRF